MKRSALGVRANWPLREVEVTCSNVRSGPRVDCHQWTQERPANSALQAASEESNQQQALFCISRSPAFHNAASRKQSQAMINAGPEALGAPQRLCLKEKPNRTSDLHWSIGRLVNSKDWTRSKGILAGAHGKRRRGWSTHSCTGPPQPRFLAREGGQNLSAGDSLGKKLPKVLSKDIGWGPLAVLGHSNELCSPRPDIAGPFQHSPKIQHSSTVESEGTTPPLHSSLRLCPGSWKH